MTNPRSVNQALDELVELDGKPVELEGILDLEPEGYHLLHYPKAVRLTATSNMNRAYGFLASPSRAVFDPAPDFRGTQRARG